MERGRMVMMGKGRDEKGNKRLSEENRRIGNTINGKRMEEKGTNSKG